MNDIERAGLTIPCPFHIHRLAIVFFNNAGLTGQGQDFRITQHELLSFCLRGWHIARSTRGISDHLDLFAAQLFFEDGSQIGVAQKRFENLILIRINGTLHDVFAKPPDCIDQYGIGKACLSIDGEHDT